MKIEDKLNFLERVVKLIHSNNHIWFQDFIGEEGKTILPGEEGNKTKHKKYVEVPVFYKVCFCGEQLMCTQKEYSNLPTRNWYNPDRDNY